LITRYFGGLFASSPVSNVGATMGDIWAPKVRGTAVVFYALAVVGGPTLVWYIPTPASYHELGSNLSKEA
jgi:hypothetical protein